MPTPATYTVGSTAVYRSLDGKDSRRFKSGAVIDYGDAIKFGMVAAPAALPPLYGALRLDLASFSIDDDNVVSSGGLAVTPGFVYPLVAPQDGGNGATIDAAPGALADFTVYYNSPGYLVGLLDLSNVSQVRLLARVNVAGADGLVLTMRYATDDATFADVTTGDLTLAMDATGWQDTGWQPLAAGAQGVVYLRPFTGGGDDGNTTASVQPLFLLFQ